jgi:hypothetical protein
MNARKQTTQRALFESQFPNWNSLPREAQQSLLDVLSQLLVDALEQHDSDPITTSTTEDNDNHVS